MSKLINSRMKKVIILSLLLTSCYSVERNCLDFKTGVFEFSTSINDSIVKSKFTRTNEFEIEMYNGIEDSSTITWVNNCEFLLTKINPRTNQEKRPIRIKIIRTYGEKYDFEYSQVIDAQKISKDAKFIILTDKTPNGGLYFLNRKGWSIKDTTEVSFKKIKEFKRLGADYLVNTTTLTFDYPQIWSNNNVSILKLK